MKMKTRTLKPRTIVTMTRKGQKEYRYVRKVLSPMLYLPLPWLIGENEKYEITRIDDARSFIITPTNMAEQELIMLYRGVKRRIREKAKAIRGKAARTRR